MAENSEKKVVLVPPITEKLLEENEEFQKQIRRQLNTAPVNPVMAARARALLQAEEIKHLMRALYGERRAARKAENTEKVSEINLRVARLGDKLAKLFLEAGEFELAYKATRNPKLRARARSFIKAVEIDDDAWECGHQKWFSFDGKRHPNFFRERDVWSAKHGRVVSVIRCNECGFRNIRPIPDDLAEMSRIRAEARKKK